MDRNSRTFLVNRLHELATELSSTAQDLDDCPQQYDDKEMEAYVAAVAQAIWETPWTRFERERAKEASLLPIVRGSRAPYAPGNIYEIRPGVFIATVLNADGAERRLPSEHLNKSAAEVAQHGFTLRDA